MMYIHKNTKEIFSLHKVFEDEYLIVKFSSVSGIQIKKR